MALHGVDESPILDQGRQVRGLGAGGGTEIEYTAPGLWLEQTRDEYRRTRLGHDRATAPQLGAVGVESAFEHEALGKP
jgi:hypothetical protein